MTDPQAELRALFCEALDRATPEQQAAYLDRACEGRPELRSRLEALLQANAEASGFLQEPTGRLTPTVEATVREGPGTMPRVSYFGDYELRGEIARGGMGIVYRARQVSPRPGGGSQDDPGRHVRVH